VLGKRITIVGYIIKTNLPDAPRCAVHPPGKGDSEDCRATVPTFWIGDTPDASLSETIQVAGWASSYAQVYGAIQAYAGASKEPYRDEFWGNEVPKPLPVHSAKVRVTGEYGRAFTMAVSGVVYEPSMGILTCKEMETSTPAPTVATLPGMPKH
jgi:hypothetical protein